MLHVPRKIQRQSICQGVLGTRTTPTSRWNRKLTLFWYILRAYLEVQHKNIRDTPYRFLPRTCRDMRIVERVLLGTRPSGWLSSLGKLFGPQCAWRNE